MARMADVRRVQSGLWDAADRDHAAASSELEREREPSRNLGGARRPVRARGARMRRHDVPEHDTLLEPELGEDAVHDRGARLRRACARELSLRGEWDPGNPRAPVAGGLADEDERRLAAGVEVGGESSSPRRRARAVTIEVECLADRDAGEPRNEL